MLTSVIYTLNPTLPLTHFTEINHKRFQILMKGVQKGSSSKLGISACVIEKDLQIDPFLEDKCPFCWATDTPVLDFW